MRRKYTLFVSWQSDIPKIRNKIMKSINRQAEQLAQEHNIILEIDQATRDIPGSPKIEDAIFEKICQCDFFLADITPITQLKEKRIPNPNVSIELGFAIKTLGWNRIILVAANDDSWKIENLPFDINHHRIGKINLNESLDLSYEIKSCIDVCYSGEQKGFVYRDERTNTEENTTISLESVIFFANRMGQGFPGLRGLQEFTDKKEITNRLQSFFDCRLRFNKAIGFAKIDPIWWFRDGSAANIEHFEVLDENHILLSGDELNIKKLIAYNAGSGDYYRDYIYIECAADPPCGTEKHSEQCIKDSIESRGYYSEEYAVYRADWNSPEYTISRQEYDDGAAIINGNIVPLYGKAKLRIRYLTPYNCIIAAKDSPYNCREYEMVSGNYLNHLLNDSVDFNDFHTFLLSLKRRDNDY